MAGRIFVPIIRFDKNPNAEQIIKYFKHCVNEFKCLRAVDILKYEYDINKLLLVWQCGKILKDRIYELYRLDEDRKMNQKKNIKIYGDNIQGDKINTGGGDCANKNKSVSGNSGIEKDSNKKTGWIGKIINWIAKKILLKK